MEAGIGRHARCSCFSPYAVKQGHPRQPRRWTAQTLGCPRGIPRFCPRLERLVWPPLGGLHRLIPGSLRGSRLYHAWGASATTTVRLTGTPAPSLGVAPGVGYDHQGQRDQLLFRLGESRLSSSFESQSPPRAAQAAGSEPCGSLSDRVTRHHVGPDSRLGLAVSGRGPPLADGCGSGPGGAWDFDGSC